MLVEMLIVLSCGCHLRLQRRAGSQRRARPQPTAVRQAQDLSTTQCDRCHEPYSSRGRGPGLEGFFQHKYLSLSGLPANDERVTDIIRLGRNEMPGYSQTLNSQDIQDLLAYLHTL